MNPLEFDAFATAARLALALDEGGIPHAIGGAIAYGLWGDPRGTYDVDINLFVDPVGLDRALDVLEQAGVALDRDAAWWPYRAPTSTRPTFVDGWST